MTELDIESSPLKRLRFSAGVTNVPFSVERSPDSRSTIDVTSNAEAASVSSVSRDGESEVIDMREDVDKNKIQGDKAGDCEIIVQNADAVSEEVPPAELIFEEKLLKVKEVGINEQLKEQVLDLYKKYFGITDTLHAYLRGEHRARHWILVAGDSPILAVATVRVHPYLHKSGFAWAQIMYTATACHRRGLGTTLIAGLEELLWAERVDMYGLHSLSPAVSFWESMGLLRDVVMLPRSEHAKIPGVTRWVSQSDSDGPLPMFAKRLSRPYSHPPFAWEGKGHHGMVNNKNFYMRHEIYWKRTSPDKWPPWRLLDVEHSYIEGSDLFTRRDHLAKSIAVKTACDMYEGVSLSVLRQNRLELSYVNSLRKVNIESFQCRSADGHSMHNIMMPSAMVQAGVEIHPPFRIKLDNQGNGCFTLIWRPTGKGTVETLLRSHEPLPTVAQIELAVNGSAKWLEGHCQCIWDKYEAVGHEFAMPAGDATLSLTIFMSANGPCPARSNKQPGSKLSFLDFSAIQGKWFSDRKGMVFEVRGAAVVLLNSQAAISGMPQFFASLKHEFVLGQKKAIAWLRLHTYELILDTSSRDQLQWRSRQNAESIITWRRQPMQGY